MAAEVRVKSENATYVGYEIDGITQFKNVPFGIVPGRFKPPQMTTNVGVIDCTKQGPICPQDELYSDSYLGVDPGKVRPIEYNVEEFGCLNLMITAPRSQGQSQRTSQEKLSSQTYSLEQNNNHVKKLPVVVWVHGGSNCMGTAYRGVNDPFNWVKRGSETQRPFIVVTIQFRVHLFGFLPFKGMGNFGLMDQKLAIDWIAENIGYWGGDPNKISVFGQSSGSQCVYALTCHPERRFQQAAYLSGSIYEFRSRTLDDYAKLTEKICSILHCCEDDLESLPWQDLVEAFRQTGVLVLSPVNDGAFLPEDGYEKTPSIPRVLVSDCHQDGWFFMDGVPEGALVKLIAPYIRNATKKLTSNQDVCRVLTDRIFFRGNYKTARELEKRGATVFTQCFDAINPLTPSLGNNHMVEILYVLEAYELPDERKGLCRAVQDAWTRFIYFEDPWPQDAFALVKDQIDIQKMAELPLHRDFDALDLEMDFAIIRETVTGW